MLSHYLGVVSLREIRVDFTPQNVDVFDRFAVQINFSFYGRKIVVLRSPAPPAVFDSFPAENTKNDYPHALWGWGPDFGATPLRLPPICLLV